MGSVRNKPIETSGSIQDWLDDEYEDDEFIEEQDYTEEQHQMDDYAEQHGTYIEYFRSFYSEGILVEHTHYGNNDQIYEIYDSNHNHIGTAHSISEMNEIIEEYNSRK